MAAEDYCSVLLPGDMMTVRVTSLVREGEPLAITGSMEVARATAGSLAFVGIAKTRALTGEMTSVMVGGSVQEALADGAITAGALVTVSGGGVGTPLDPAARRLGRRRRPGPARRTPRDPGNTRAPRDPGNAGAAGAPGPGAPGPGARTPGPRTGPRTAR